LRDLLEQRKIKVYEIGSLNGLNIANLPPFGWGLLLAIKDDTQGALIMIGGGGRMAISNFDNPNWYGWKEVTMTAVQ
jgi:hypothetical protein